MDKTLPIGGKKHQTTKMQVIDKGHLYKLPSFDGEHYQMLRFVKRRDTVNPPRFNRFPGNTNSYPGTTMQPVLRALLERLRYLQNQIWSVENAVIIPMLRVALWLLESRAARRHGLRYWKSLRFAETASMCKTCGHTVCEH